MQSLRIPPQSPPQRLIAAPAQDISLPPQTPDRNWRLIRCWPRLRPRPSHPRAGGLQPPRQSLAASASWLPLYSRRAIAGQGGDESAGPTALLPSGAGQLTITPWKRRSSGQPSRCSACWQTFCCRFGGAWPRPFLSSSHPGGSLTAALGSKLRKLQVAWVIQDWVIQAWVTQDCVMVKPPPVALQAPLPFSDQFPEMSALVSVYVTFVPLPFWVAVPVTFPVRVRVLPADSTIYAMVPVTLSFDWTVKGIVPFTVPPLSGKHSEPTPFAVRN